MRSAEIDVRALDGLGALIRFSRLARGRRFCRGLRGGVHGPGRASRGRPWPAATGLRAEPDEIRRPRLYAWAAGRGVACPSKHHYAVFGQARSPRPFHRNTLPRRRTQRRSPALGGQPALAMRMPLPHRDGEQRAAAAVRLRPDAVRATRQPSAQDHSGSLPRPVRDGADRHRRPWTGRASPAWPMRGRRSFWAFRRARLPPLCCPSGCARSAPAASTGKLWRRSISDCRRAWITT